MRFVVDASVAVKWLVEEPDSDDAQKLAASGEDLHAPRLMASEVANALWRKARQGQIGRGDASAAVAWVPNLPVHWNGTTRPSVRTPFVLRWPSTTRFMIASISPLHTASARSC